MKKGFGFLCFWLSLLLILAGATGCEDSYNKAIETVKTGYLGEYTDVTVEELLDNYYVKMNAYDSSEWDSGETDDGKMIVQVTYTGEYFDPVKIQFSMKEGDCFKVTALKDPNLEKPQATDVAGLLNDAYYQYYIVNHEEIVGNFLAELSFIESLSDISGAAVMYGAPKEYSGDRSQLYQIFDDKPLDVNVPLLLDACGLLDLNYYYGGTVSFGDYVGFWEDSYSQRCNMTIDAIDDSSCRIQINWSSSALESTHWNMIGHYNFQTGELDYQNCVQRNIEYSDDGNETEDIIYVDGTGSFYLEDDYLHWDDRKEQVGAQCLFEKSDTDYSLGQGIEITTEFFSVTVPSSWGEYGLYDDSGYSLAFYEEQSYNDFYQEGGLLFSINLISTSEYEDWPETTVLGILEVPNMGTYNVVIAYPSDVQYSETGKEQYVAMSEDIPDILSTFTPCENCSWQAW